ncbi:MAG: hypothetical protein ABSF26_15135 [Thermoguttaceae bacterium]|jgi:hypothetical protein
MHFCTFVIIGTHNDPEAAVAHALEPFDEALTVEPYRDYLDPSEIEHMSAHYGISATDLPALVRKMPDWRRSEGGVDERGLYALTTYNPNGRWDWYEIGGRWNRYIPGFRGNVIRVETLLKRRDLRSSLPYSIVTPDGQWLERQDAPWFESHTGADRRREARWSTEVRDALAPYRDRKVVCVDVHS